MYEPKGTFIGFITAFVAEIGDKSQVLTFLYATDKSVNPWMLFACVSLALVTATGLGVIAGNTLGSFVSAKYLALFAGTGFLLLGCLSLWSATQL
ncbi:MAG: putative Ca2+/H+ antiporter (TMEM165/GDT1 family) [Flavobacteriales bacterium]|jgi:putative Ca2+/H+ antiporter (TMEM165/GDT1 family)